MILLALVTRYSRGLWGFGIWLQLMFFAYLLTLSEYFKWGRTFRLWMKYEASLHTEGSIGVMKLGVWPLELAFRLTTRAVRVRYWSTSI